MSFLESLCKIVPGSYQGAQNLRTALASNPPTRMAAENFLELAQDRGLELPVGWYTLEDERLLDVLALAYFTLRRMRLDGSPVGYEGQTPSPAWH